jgi:GntR family transcriptional regulator, transcriptional repressor for pyruvate dehydrogenase complex
LEPLTTRPRVYEDAAEAIRQYIAQNHLRPGDPLPPERQIQQQLEISRASVREALRTLQMIGLVEARRGKGLFVKKLDLQPMVRALTSNLELIDGISVGHLVDVRKALELELAEVAAMRRTAEDAARLATSLERMRQALTEGDVAMALTQDLKFHEILVQISRNPLFERFYSSIAAFLVDIRERSPQTTETQTASLREHDAIYRAIRDQDPAGAVDAMRMHLAGLDEQLGVGASNTATAQLAHTAELVALEVRNRT